MWSRCVISSDKKVTEESERWNEKVEEKYKRQPDVSICEGIIALI
jgi:hypothetical protein